MADQNAAPMRVRLAPVLVALALVAIAIGGSWYYFQPKGPTCTPGEHRNELWVMGSDGTSPRLIVDRLNGSVIVHARFSPDGLSLVVQGGPSSISGNPPSVAIVPISGGNPTTLGFQGDWATFGNDGKKLIYSRDGKIMSNVVETGSTSQILDLRKARNNTRSEVFSLSVGRSDDSILFSVGEPSTHPPSNSQLAMVKVDGSGYAELGLKAESGTLLPDGTGVIFPEDGRIKMHELATKTTVTLVDTGTKASRPVSGQGGDLVFTAGDCRFDVWLSNIDGQHVRKITNDPKVSFVSEDVSPGGELVLFRR